MMSKDLSARRVFLNGGLGNQLFGLAFGMYLKESLDFQVVLDVSDLGHRGYQLSDLNLPEGIVIGDLGAMGSFLNRLANSKYQVAFPRSFYIEKDLRFDARLTSDMSRRVYFGYFQNWNYVEPILCKLHSIIPKEEFSSNFMLLEEEYLRNDFTAIHIRRGDYLDSLSYHGIAEESYYRSAFQQYMPADHPSIVFSDDISLAKVIYPGATRYIGNETLSSPMENLIAMSKSSNFIGANSSLSWWAAALNSKQNAEIIFPTPWFSNSSLDTQTLLSPSWKVMARS